MDQNTSALRSAAGGYMRGWQQTGLRMLRAQERVMQGIAKAARLELKYGQDLASSRLALLEWTETDSEARAGRTMRELESLMNMMRDVTEELNHSFSDAARLLAAGMESQVEDTMRESEAALDQGFKKAREMAREGADTAVGMTREGMQGIQDVMPDEEDRI